VNSSRLAGVRRRWRQSTNTRLLQSTIDRGVGGVYLLLSTTNRPSGSYWRHCVGTTFQSRFAARLQILVKGRRLSAVASEASRRKENGDDAWCSMSVTSFGDGQARTTAMPESNFAVASSTANAIVTLQRNTALRHRIQTLPVRQRTGSSSSYSLATK
jgi:hypothetical protein